VADVNEPVATPPGADTGSGGTKFLGLKTWQLLAIGGATLVLIYMVIKGKSSSSTSSTTSGTSTTTASAGLPSTGTDSQLNDLQSELMNMSQELSSGSGTATGNSVSPVAGTIGTASGDYSAVQGPVQNSDYAAAGITQYLDLNGQFIPAQSMSNIPGSLQPAGGSSIGGGQATYTKNG